MGCKLRYPLAFPIRHVYNLKTMKEHSEKIPNPKELEKEISEFLAKKVWR